LWVEVYGSKTFLERNGKDKIRIDLTDYEGLTMLVGPGGHGKSSLFDYISPFSVLFLQPNSLMSTFEFGDSYIKQAYDVNGTEYQIEKYFKPTLKSPKAEYYAFEVVNGERIPTGETESGLRQPFDEWCLQMFGSPRRYATSVLHTQFSDNQSKFQGQSINPSIVQAGNIELKGLFHELAGTDLKHLEMKCKSRRDKYNDMAETEEVKKQGVEENIPSKTDIQYKIDKQNEAVIIKETEDLIEALGNEVQFNTEVDKIEKLEEENRRIDAVISSLNDQITEEKTRKITLESDLSSIGNIDVEALNREIIKLEDDKNKYETRLKALPNIQKTNNGRKLNYKDAFTRWESDFAVVSDFNINAQKTIDQIKTAKIDKERAESEIKRKTNQASIDETKENSRLKTDFQNRKQVLESEIRTLVEQIKTGQEMIDNIKACPECGFIDPEGVRNKERYNERLKERESEKEAKQKELSVLKVPGFVGIIPATGEEVAEISKCDIIILQDIPGLKDIPVKPTEPDYEDETIPVFDSERYTKVKEQLSGYSEDRITELRTRITESQNRISSLEAKIIEQVKKPIDYSAKEKLKESEENVSRIQREIDTLNTSIKINESKLEDIDKMRLSLVEYDNRIEEYRKEESFWSDMKNKWGPSGIPARILEHTGPYVDKLANDILAEYYPTYKFHSETTRMGTDGTEKEIFSINLINQETGREKPLSAISGEERNFCIFALREAFRRVNKENSMVEWTVQYEDEPDAHVSSKYIQQFYDMVESFSEKRTVFAIAHSSEVKTRSSSVIDITNI
nr:hypothetical protein [Spirochaetaceae bacterium]